MKKLLYLFIYLCPILLLITCKKEAIKVLSTVNTTAATNITSTTATSGGTITNDGGAPVTSRGVCWSLNQSPTTSDNKTSDGSGIGSFTSSITGLSPGGTYHVRAYATNSIGTGYGNQFSFTTSAIIPTLTTTAITDIGATRATSGGNILSDGGSAVIARGVCWSINQSPTISDNKSTNDTGTGSFISSLTGLTPSTTYYVRAYATNSVGTGYGSTVSFKTVETVTDIDGNVYHIVTIGTQDWLAENLKTTKYHNGNLIGTTTPATLDISNATTYPTPKYQWAYAGNESNVATYGRLYTWYAATDSRNVCPTGWHVPTEGEWTTLTTFLGGESVAGGKLKEAGTSHWISPNTGATNSSGFTALPGGHRSINTGFEVINVYSVWWCSNEYDTTTAWYRLIFSDRVSFQGYYNNKAYGYSVRCLRD